MNEDLEHGTVECAHCRERFPLDQLDAKPERLAGPGNWFVRYVMPRLRRDALGDAYWANEDFDRLECERCYGPGFVCSV